MPSEAADLPAEEKTTLVRSDGRRHYLALDSLRGICACAVALMHFSTDAYLTQNGLVQHAFLFVDFFFVLSGFVIAESYGRKLAEGLSLWRFMALRIGRLYPLHAAILLALLALQIAGALFGVAGRGGAQHSISGFLLSFFFLQIFANGAIVDGWNVPSWSISAEFWTYLIFAIVMILFSRWRIAILLASIVAMPFLIGAQSDRHINVCYDGALARCVFGFFTGVLCQTVWRRLQDRLKLSLVIWSLIEAICILFCGGAVWVFGAGPLSYLAPAIFAVTIFVFAHEGGVVSRLLVTKPLLLLGAWSYSIYLVHEFVQARAMNVLALRGWHMLPGHGGGLVEHVITRAQPFFLASDLLTVGLLILTIATAAFTYRFIEAPGRQLSRRWLIRDAPRPVA